MILKTQEKIDRYEKQLEALTQTILFEQAFRYTDARYKIMNLSGVIFRHLVEVLLIKDEAYDHHIDEINTWLSDCQDYGKVKLPSRVRLTTEEYYDILFGDEWDDEYEYNFKSKILRIIKKYFSKESQEYRDSEYENINFQSLFQKIRSIYKRVSEDLHLNTFSNIRDYID